MDTPDQLALRRVRERIVQEQERATRLAGPPCLVCCVTQQLRSRVILLGELRRCLERGRGLRVPAASPCRRRAPLELSRERGVGLVRRRGQMPGTALTTSACERLVRGTEHQRGGSLVYGRAEQRVLEAEARSVDHCQTGALGGVERVRLEACALDRSNDLVEV